jgi:hypothetical protein
LSLVVGLMNLAWYPGLLPPLLDPSSKPTCLPLDQTDYEAFRCFTSGGFDKASLKAEMETYS